MTQEHRRNEMPRSHRDRHPGLTDALDNPHPVERRLSTLRPAGRVASGKPARRSESPR